MAIKPKRPKFDARWGREDYARMILPGATHLVKKEKSGRRGGNRRSGVNGRYADALVLSRLIGSTNKNVKQREAIIDGMSGRQMKDVGKLFKQYLESSYSLPRGRIKQLIRDKEFVDALTKFQGDLKTRKKILKQKGGIIPFLLPLLAKALAPAILGTALSH